MVRNVTEHNSIGSIFDMSFVHLPLQLVIPGLLLIIAFLNSRENLTGTKCEKDQYLIRSRLNFLKSFVLVRNLLKTLLASILN
ncbi:hypothetical protein GCM10020331_084900 [Ectobacillus funiculus]